MFVRSCWSPPSVDECNALIDAHPWALLVSNGPDGPVATNLPLMRCRSDDGPDVLVGHLSRANEHATLLQNGGEPVLAVFEGPASYVTPTWYPKRDMPGTYYYTAVHCYGRVRVVNQDALEESLGALNSRMEAEIPDGWSLSEIPHSEITRRLPGIVGFELAIERIEGKFKLGQDEPLADASAVADRLAAQDDPVQRRLAEMVRNANTRRRDDGEG